MIVVLKMPRFYGGGPSQEQKDAATRQAAAEEKTAATQQQMLDIYNKGYNEIEPFATDRLKNGLPFYNDMIDYAGGENARAYQPARARLMRTISSMGPLPSGSAQQTLADFEAKRARDFDSSLQNTALINDQAKVQGAGLITGQQAGANPLGWTNAQTQQNSSIMNAPLQSPGLAGPILGAVGALGSSAITKF